MSEVQLVRVEAEETIAGKRGGTGAANGRGDRERWARHVQTWAAGGLSQAEYCRREGLRYSRFLYWRRKLGSGGGMRLVRVPTGGAAAGICVRVGEYGVEIREGFSAATLAEVVQVLRRV